MALENRKVIGVISLSLCFSMPRMRPYAMLSDLYVHPGHRGRGAAAYLLVGAMDASHRDGCAFLTTDLGEPLVGIFLRHGWNEDGGALTVEIDPEGPPPSLTLTGDWQFD
jgi:GNAT superfamily N-acetyltransferase